MNHKGYLKESDCFYKVSYYFAWRVRDGTLFETTAQRQDLLMILEQICDEYGYIVHDITYLPDSNSDVVLVFLSALPNVAPCDIVRTLKSISMVRLLKTERVKEFYVKSGSLWEPSCFISTQPIDVRKGQIV